MTSAQHIAVLGAAPPRQAAAAFTERLLLIVLFVTVLVSSIAFIEPSPHDALMGALALACLVAGVRFERALVPLLMMLLLWNVAGLVSLISVVGVWLFHRAGQNEAIRDAKDQTRIAAQGSVEPALSDGLLREQPSALAAVDRVIQERVLTDDAIRNEMVDKTPLKRLGEPDDIAIGVLYLASPAASFITGKLFEIDGGLEEANLALNLPDV